MKRARGSLTAFATLTALAAAAIAAAALHAQGAGEGPSAPRVVRLDAIAADAGGRLITDLTPADFEVIERGESRPIESVRFVRATGAAAGGAAAEPITSVEQEQAAARTDGTRLFALFLDEYHVSPGAPAARARALLTDFIEHQLGPADLALVVKPLDSLPNLRMTRDRDALRAAIAGFEGRKGDYTPRTSFERDYIPPDPRRIDAVRTQIALSALSAIAAHIGPLNDGRKTILVVSEGFGTLPRRRGDLPLPSIDGVVRAANRSHASIYAIDPAATAPGATVADEDSAALLRTLATGTDGRAMLTAADVGAGLQRMVSDASGYYLIAFEPSRQAETGRYHPIDVRVRRAGVALRTRSGYWEPPPDAAAVLRRAETAPRLPATHASPLIRPWFGMTRADDGRTRVQFAWEPAPRVPGDRSRAAAPARAILSVRREDGTLVYEQPVAPRRGDDGDAADDGVARIAAFDLDPGRVAIEIRIEDEDAKVLDTDIRELTVGALDNRLSLGTVQVFRARSARELREIAAATDRAPAVTRQFTRAEVLLIRVPVYAPNGEAELTATLQSALGGQMREIPVTAGASPEIRTIELPLAGLAAGDYRLALLATAGSASTSDTLAFRVIP
jgi:VWFA-related protein